MLDEIGNSASQVQMRVSDGHPPVVSIEGDLDFETAPEVRDALIRMVDRGQPCLTIALGACGFVDSSGMLALVATAHRAIAAGGCVRLREVPPMLAKLLNLSHLGHVLGIREELPCHPHVNSFVDTGVGRWEVSRLVSPATPQSCAPARRHVVRECAGTPLSQEDRADIELAVGEAFANAVRHGAPGGGRDVVRLRALRGRDAFVVEVSDNGTGFERSQIILPCPEEIREGGMGIFYMEALMDQVDFDSGPHGTTVRLVKRYPQQGERS